MEHTASPLNQVLTELRTAAAAQAARDSVISNLVLLFLNHLIRLFSSLDSVFQAWREGTLPPPPEPRQRQHAPRRQKPASNRPGARTRARQRPESVTSQSQTPAQPYPAREPAPLAGQNPRPRPKIPIQPALA